MDEDNSEAGVLYEDEAVEVVETDETRPPEDELREDMEELEVGGEGDSDDGEMAVVPVRDDADCCFRAHSGSMFSVSLHPSCELACSGGEDDKAFVWRVADGAVVFECQGHKDSVTCTGFSHDGKYLATADMAGLVQVWAVASGERVQAFETGDIEWMQWHHQAHVLLAGTSDGGGWMWKVPSGDCKTFQGQSCRNTCCALMRDGKRASFGYEDGSVRVWDLKQGTTVTSITGLSAHKRAVTCLASHSENVLLFSGSEDSTAKLINSSTGKILATFAAGFPAEGGSSSEEPPPSIEAVGFSPSMPLALTASLSGVLAVWDIPSQKLRQQCRHKAGVVRLHCSAAAPLVFSGCLDGGVRVWDVRTGGCVREWFGHTDEILDIAIATDDSIILSGSGDNCVRVFSNKSPPR